MARKAGRYVQDKPGFAAFMMSDGVGDAAQGIAQDMIPFAKEFAHRSDPADKGAGDGTRFVDHFGTERKIVTIKGVSRQAAAMTNDAEYAVNHEFGRGPIDRRQGGNHGAPARPMVRAAGLFGDFRGGA